jgi:hypothetical protein
MYCIIPLTDHFRRDEHSRGLFACDARESQKWIAKQNYDPTNRSFKSAGIVPTGKVLQSIQ